jgi:hypothetical protein
MADVRQAEENPRFVEEFTGLEGPTSWAAISDTARVTITYPKGQQCSQRAIALTCSYHSIPYTSHLLKSQQIKNWINNYQPRCGSVEAPDLDVQFDADSSHILWAADVWYSIKKHWVLELQRLIRAKSTPHP